MLQILYGRKCIFSEISEQINRGVTDQILIVPQHYSHEAERRLCEVCGDSAALYCEVLTIKRLADRVFGIEGGLAGHVLDEWTLTCHETRCFLSFWKTEDVWSPD